MEYEIPPEEETTTAVVEAVSTVERIPCVSLPPLYESVDPCALNELFEPTDRDTDRDGLISFTYSDCLVSVQHDEYVRVEEKTDRSPVE